MTPDEAVVVRQLLGLVVERVHGPGVDDILKRAEDLLSPDPCVVAGVEVRTLTAKQLGIAASDDDSYRSVPDNPPWNDRWTVGRLHLGFDADGLHLWSGTRSIVVPAEDVDNVLTAIRAARAVVV